jgi:hypothetical protein
MSRCHDDLTAITKYVTWSLNERGGSAVSRALPDRTDLVSVYQVTLEATTNGNEDKANNAKHKKEETKSSFGPLVEKNMNAPQLITEHRNVDRDYQNLLQLMEEAMMSRNNNRTNMVVGGLVQHIVTGWTSQFCQSVVTKFNCYFMLPFVDEFHRFARYELQKAYDGETDCISDVFDMTSARESLQKHRDHLVKECLENKKLQEKFQLCAAMMTKGETSNLK